MSNDKMLYVYAPDAVDLDHAQGIRAVNDHATDVPSMHFSCVSAGKPSQLEKDTLTGLETLH